MKKILSIGELLIDFIPKQKGCSLDEVTDFERVAEQPGRGYLHWAAGEPEGHGISHPGPAQV